MKNIINLQHTSNNDTTTTTTTTTTDDDDDDDNDDNDDNMNDAKTFSIIMDNLDKLKDVNMLNKAYQKIHYNTKRLNEEKKYNTDSRKRVICTIKKNIDIYI